MRHIRQLKESNVMRLWKQSDNKCRHSHHEGDECFCQPRPARTSPRLTIPAYFHCFKTMESVSSPHPIWLLVLMNMRSYFVVIKTNQRQWQKGRQWAGREKSAFSWGSKQNYCHHRAARAKTGLASSKTTNAGQQPETECWSWLLNKKINES